MKIIVVGSSGVGKTSLLDRFVSNTFTANMPTINYANHTKSIRLTNGRPLKLDLWDTAGQERFQTLITAFYRQVVGVVYVYDINELPSFYALQEWMEKVKRHNSLDCHVSSIVGMKLDILINREVNKGAAERFAQRNNMGYYECSALSGYQCSKVFVELAERAYKVPALIPFMKFGDLSIDIERGNAPFSLNRSAPNIGCGCSVV